MRSTGEQFAKQYALAPAGTISALQAAMNQVWSALDWGWVEIQETNDSLVLSHYYAPLQGAFGPDQQAWSIAFLEGAYDCWMYQSGADAQLHVTSAGNDGTSGALVFHFGG
jgi:hypothetical protein